MINTTSNIYSAEIPVISKFVTAKLSRILSCMLLKTVKVNRGLAFFVCKVIKKHYKAKQCTFKLLQFS